MGVAAEVNAFHVFSGLKLVAGADPRLGATACSRPALAAVIENEYRSAKPTNSCGSDVAVSPAIILLRISLHIHQHGCGLAGHHRPHPLSPFSYRGRPIRMRLGATS